MSGRQPPTRTDTVVLGLDGQKQGFDGSPQAALQRARERHGFCWVRLNEPSPAQLDELAEPFGLHPLALEDAKNAHKQRPKIELYDELTFLVLKTVTYAERQRPADSAVSTGVVLIFTGPNFVITVETGQSPDWRDVRDRIKAQQDLTSAGTAAVVHAVTDTVVDDYLRAATAVESEIDDLESKVFSAERGAHVERIYQLKREVLALRRAVGPAVEPLSRLAESAGASDAADGATLKAYFGDVEDHVIRVRDQIAGEDDLLTSILQANLSQITVIQGDDTRRISAWVAIVAVPTLVAGIYGMNFEHMPELRLQYGYPMVLAGIALICTALYRGFKHNGWL